MTARVALVLVSHSVELARGVAELAEQMAPDVLIRGVGGRPDGGLGTSLDAVQKALEEVLTTLADNTPGDSPGGGADGSGVVVLGDLGSSVLTVEAVLELDESLTERVVLARAPFVEGAVAAAVTAHGGADLGTVLESAASSIRMFAAIEATQAPEAGEATSGGEPEGSRTVTVRNPLGLHARPAALVSRKVAELGATVTIDGVDASSVLQLMALGATQGRELRVEATGERAAEAVATVVEMIDGGFGEV
ncbi:Phosphocarrier protein HPr/dihydroxyacetone kinase DhaM subunit (EC 2.7.1.121) [Promicromonospora umidemergens]|uniref:Phosphocarrier protein HPr n=1 Tax=Promicromonospora umidemergens TaxID=629679 RepID=A0ABP8XDS4_9MICO|nr:HPr family phosphocarrier protein [Promicromonospora umidemergens]MCP2282994.1 Phosphocarrier protein HPr/dihydroxyacetone kinase DhaM subunit (EC 2.7.1.121) [Promicromonospora umidemergens]